MKIMVSFRECSLCSLGKPKLTTSMHPGIQQNAPISALIKPIGLCGTQNAQKKIWTRPTIFRKGHFVTLLLCNHSYLKEANAIQD